MVLKMNVNRYLSFFVFLILIPVFGASGQMDNFWKGKKCAVVLTYDDGLNVHLDHAIPLLDSLGLKGTFYIPGNSPPFANRLDEWRNAAQTGHELGNHTLFHPCIGNRPGREFVSEDHDLGKYSLQQIVDEVRLANTLLKAVDGKDQRTFAYTCGDREVGGEYFYDRLREDFPAARGVYSAMNKTGSINTDNINSYMINGQTGDQMIELVDEAIRSGNLLVFLFHGVGGEHSLNVSLSAHRKLLEYLEKNKDVIWTDSLVEVALYLNKEVNK